MYTIQENVRIVISVLKKYNIRHIVISPGGTNIPITQAIQNDTFFKCYSVVDERSAMYFAIGIYLQTGEIVATTCTSAQATRNYVPGLTEAFYKHAPILAITTSKLKRFEYQDYMQAPEQCSLPNDAVKKTFDLPPVSDENTRLQCIHDAKAAILELTHGNPGPVQLNIRITDALQSKFEDCELPAIRPLKRYMAWDEWPASETSDKRILIIVGEHRPFSERQKRALDRYCDTHNAVVYVNHLSNYSGKYAINANLLVTCGGFNKLKPDLLITIGGQTGDYPIYNALHGIGKAEHWRIAEDGEYVDTYGKLTKIFECPDYYFFERMADNSLASHSYMEEWTALNSTMKYDIDLPLSNLYVAQQMYKYIPADSIMNFAILNSLRCWSYFPINPNIQGYGNVAAFGIDGCNSMLFGESMNTEKLCFIVTGDLAFFYDMNALGIRHIKNNVRILLVNNGGGAEFKIMTRNWKVDVEVDDFISANGHNGNAKGWSENCGFMYIGAKDKNDVLKAIPVFTSPSEKPILLEVFTAEEDEMKAMVDMIGNNCITSAKDSMRNIIANIVGEKGVEIIKQFIKR